MVHDNSSEQHDVEDNERDEEGVPAPEETIDSENVGDIIARNVSANAKPIQKKKKISAIEKTTDHHEQLIYQIGSLLMTRNP
ncbi:6080_t:CDS:2 [Rhizophagus irregularis]|nr:6080_t:CDS:2 [Rhizophagus irregularis]